MGEASDAETPVAPSQLVAAQPIARHTGEAIDAKTLVAPSQLVAAQDTAEHTSTE